jgi:small-conductance mechanosensitive channel
MANEILNLAFQYARAQADFIAKTTGNTGAAVASPYDQGISARLADIKQKADAADAEVASLQARIKDLQTRQANATGKQRAANVSALAAAQSQLDLAQARADAIKAIVQFESGTILPAQGGGLAAQIDELEKSIAESDRNGVKPVVAVSNGTAAASAAPAIAPTRAAPSGILSLITDLLALQRKEQTIEEIRAQTKALSARINALIDPMLKLMGEIDRRGAALTQGTAAADAATLRNRKRAFEILLDQHKLATAATLPLRKQLVILDLYSKNLVRWNAAIDQRVSAELRSLLIRLIGLAAVFGLIFAGAALWRRFTDRYVQDIRRRGQIMAARRLVLSVAAALVLLITFADELGSFATVIGFAAAGVAVALQNVIVSIAGYFFLIGRFGMKSGDRVQIGGVTGDVVDIGMVKLSLLELGGAATQHQPTGRVAVFSNAVVFQPSGNFFKQAPGTSFIWNEVRLTLSPDCDYRLAEKRLLDAVDEVYARYRDRVQSDYRHLERDLNLLLESPKPQSRLNLSENGLEIIIRYPAETHAAPQIADEVSRRVLDAINREPSLRLAMQGIANIQPQTPPPADGDGASADKS